ncbi:hypothetical protein N0V90_002343 [Kalmusia sp. IMI 367209]|nr:hypothetical protein N0V90_002343 [Kalmusia sp. IMI 367209]
MSIAQKVLGLIGVRAERERVVVLGSGWAGYTVARALDSKKYQTVVVSPRSYFAFTPLLASTSVGTLEFRTALEPIRTRRSNVNFFQGWADAVDFKNKKITIEEAVEDRYSSQALTEDRHKGETEGQTRERRATEAKKGTLFELPYDKLIVTVGCYSQTFGTPGVKEHAFFLKDVGDARKIRNRILACFEAAALPTTTDEQRKQLLNFAVVGGGPTGIEFSAELHDIIHEDLARIYPELIPFHKITVYDVAKKVLPMFDEKLAKYAMDTFAREGIAIKTDHHVEELRPGAPGEEDASAKEHAVYTLKVKEQGTGLMQNPFVAQARDQVYEVPKALRSLDFPSNDPDSPHWSIKLDPKSSSVVTDTRLRVKLVASTGSTDAKPEAILNDVFALGDCAIVEGTQYPATAQVASQKAYWLAKRLNKDDIEKAGFTWKNMGVMAYIGNWNALLQGGGTSSGVSGRLAWIIWRGAYLTKSLSVGYDGIISLWQPQTTIKIYISSNKEKSTSLEKHRRYIATKNAVQGAVDDWNATLTDDSGARPRFAQVSTKGEATCQVKIRCLPEDYGSDPNKGEVLASAFFPGQHPTITLYTAAFKEQNLPYLKNVFIHELIHVQGVRHFFAPREDKARYLKPSTLVGKKDELSVSNYIYPLNTLKIQPSDVEALTELYDGVHESINDLPVRYHHAVPLSKWSQQDEVDAEGGQEDEGWFLVNQFTRKIDQEEEWSMLGSDVDL